MEQPNTASPAPLEVWAGIECTYNRVGDRYYDQMAWNGHEARPSDLDLFASLGIQSIRYPVLWERVAPGWGAGGLDLRNARWEWPDERLNRLRELGVRPIAGFLHHGSGPAHTSLVDPAFPGKLAAYARAVGERYPWVEDYTPVNEILTTARFSGLYGHWYPHGHDPRTFIQALLIQARGTQLAMRALREVNPRARLVQTDDLGKIYSTPKLSYQAEFENERRWLALDLIMGRVDEHHPMRSYLRWAGADERVLEALLQDPVTPDIMGMNYYITSERFLDERVELYPPELVGGNDRDTYADVEAVRACHELPIGFGGIFKEAWERYHVPLAATEVHLGGFRADQLRWLMESWNGLVDLKAQGVDVRAITPWALLGSYHWDRLVTSDDGSYESGVYDARFSPPRPTVLARAVEGIARNGAFDHPILDGAGWWRRPHRLIYAPVQCGEDGEPCHEEGDPSPRKLLIAGSSSMLGTAFALALDLHGVAHEDYAHLDDELSAEEALDRVDPWAVVCAGGFAWDCAALTQACARREIPLLAFSPEGAQLPEDGQLLEELARRAPEGVELRLLEAHPRATLVRSRAMVAQAVMARAGEDEVLPAPEALPGLVNTCVDLLVDGEMGVWEVNGGRR